MTWLTPGLALAAAAVVLPLLIVLYFLKLRRTQMPVSSTLLWKRAVRDLQVNAPFQKLRKNLLLLLQLLVLLAVLLALGGPLLNVDTAPGKRYVILIDRSASMNAREGDRTRLELAKQQANEFIDTLRSKVDLSLQDSSDQAMVIAFDRRSKVMCNFTGNKQQLKHAIDSIEPTDSLSSLAEAVSVAKASAQLGIEGVDRPSHVQLELFSDGRVADATDVPLSSKDLVFHCIGERSDNLAVTAMQARRSYDKPEEVYVFCAVSNYGDKPASLDVQLSVDGSIRSVRRVDIKALSPPRDNLPAAPGKTSVTFTLNHPTAGVVQVRQLRPDALAADDAAWAILPPPKKLSVLLVSNGNLALEAGIKAASPAKFEVKNLAQFQQLAAAANGALPYDVIVLDNNCPPTLPRGRYVIFGRPPSDPKLDIKIDSTVSDQIVVDWRSRHMVLQFVDMGNVFVTKAARMTLPRDAELLAQFNDAPAMAVLRKQGTLMLLVPFDVMDSNWPFEPGFPVFWENVLQYMAADSDTSQDSALNVGQPIVASGFGPGEKVKLNAPQVQGATLQADPGGSVRYARTDLCGLYALQGEGVTLPYAVNLLDEQESHIEPARELAISGQPIAATDPSKARSNLELWPYLVMLGLLLACVEWVVYNARAKV